MLRAQGYRTGRATVTAACSLAWAPQARVPQTMAEVRHLVDHGDAAEQAKRRQASAPSKQPKMQAQIKQVHQPQSENPDLCEGQHHSEALQKRCRCSPGNEIAGSDRRVLKIEPNAALGNGKYARIKIVNKYYV